MPYILISYKNNELDTMTMPLTMLTPSQHSIIWYTTLDSILTSFYCHHPIHTNISSNIWIHLFYIFYIFYSTSFSSWLLAISPTETERQVLAPIRSWILLWFQHFSAQAPTLSDITLSLLPFLTITLSFLSLYFHSYITLSPYFISDLSASDSLSRGTPYR